MIRNAFFELFIICTLLITGMCQDILPTDSSLLYSECSESDSRSLTTVINQLKNRPDLLELPPEHLEQTTGNDILTQARFQSAAHATSISRRNTSFCNPLWYIFFYALLLPDPYYCVVLSPLWTTGLYYLLHTPAGRSETGQLFSIILINNTKN